MNSKLTLKLDKKVIDKAKLFAKANNTSLSFLVETFFERLIEKERNEHFRLSSTVKELAGVLKSKNESDPDVYKEHYLLEKYLHE